MVYCNAVFTSILMRASIVVFAVIGALAGCETLGPKPAPPASTIAKPSAPPPSKDATSAKPPVVVEPVKPPVPELSGLKQASWRDLPDWQADDTSAAWDAFRASCRALVKHEAWRDVCTVAQSMPETDRGAARRFFEASFTPFQLTNADGSEEGLITGYYEPLLKGARKPGGRYRFPVFGVPDDLLVLDLTEVYPELKGIRLRGRLEGRRVVPYFDRSQIEQGLAPLAGKEIAYVDDSIDLFFLQIQGSGRIALDSGETIRVSYADQNGHPYRSIGRILAERGDLPLEKASMQGIKAWAQANPDKLTELLNQNGSYVFFRELPADTAGPPGALGVPLTPRRSVAVDARYVPLGAPVYIATTWPLSNRPLNQLMLAQDTGGAIRGAVRADFFWGFGEEAGNEAGRMKQPLRMWVLLPKGYRLSQNARTK
jgi:peptidoglycan lytic transglycosylase A